MYEENQMKHDNQKGKNAAESSSSISAKGNIQPSFIPSIVSSLNQTHVLSGGVATHPHCFSNTQPLASFKSHLRGVDKS